MEILWYGHSCFRFSEDGCATVITDPYNHAVVGHAPLNAKANIVTISHNSPGHNAVEAVGGKPFVIDGAGEYELGGVFITGVQTSLKAPGERNTLFVFQYNDLTIAHMGGIEKLPSQGDIEQIGSINVALIPVGGSSGWTASKASELVTMLEPDYVIPMHYATDDSKISLEPLQKFLKEMGMESAPTQPSLVLRSDSPPLMEETTVIVLQCQQKG
ncbi:MAG: MBL fold metallo-hydrolase [Anaerolineae bacterium]|jgi:L-ascorbate metabolism protein UlaG (beta-lactamase superfamily)|nr:MBL fold metallo-hydrolase [Anaerolineae bacterium]